MSVASALVQYNAIFGCNITSLKELQETTLVKLLNGIDCICSLPTGYGKSLIYEMLPFICQHDTVVIVVVPLNAIMDQQIQKLGKQAFSLSGLDKVSGEERESLKRGNFKYLFCHPEQVLNNKNVNELFCSEVYQAKTVFIVIDEAHCILEWGVDFRPDFKKLFQLRALFPNCTMLALSATVTKSGQQDIAKALKMQRFDPICSCPAKDNIVLVVKKRPSPTAKGNTAETPYSYVFLPLFQQLNKEGEDFPITIVYCKTMQWIGFGFELAKQVLGNNFYVGDQKPENARVVMFHSSMERDSGKVTIPYF